MASAELAPIASFGPSNEGTGYSESAGGNLSGGWGPGAGIGAETSANGNTNINGSGVGVAYGGQLTRTFSKQCKACTKITWYNSLFIQSITAAKAIQQCFRDIELMIRFPQPENFNGQNLKDNDNGL